MCPELRNAPGSQTRGASPLHDCLLCKSCKKIIADGDKESRKYRQHFRHSICLYFFEFTNTNTPSEANPNIN